MGNELKNKILEHNGIITEGIVKKKLSVLNCPRCELVNVVENKYCSKCSHPLTLEAFDRIKQTEEIRFKELEETYSEKLANLEQNIEKKIQAILLKVNVENLRT